ncbi:MULTISPECIES: hypothetical protein [Mesorhizobium]|uniref:Uncharacterized protein n=1 Tax=Mesorhizobium shonense TaxID=1209948 RepID=A0ABV2HW03_9HYPH|nr:hypothetical protein [Mesorhizobium sp.]
MDDTGTVLAVEMVIVSAWVWLAHRPAAIAIKDAEEQNKRLARTEFFANLILEFPNKFM